MWYRIVIWAERNRWVARLLRETQRWRRQRQNLPITIDDYMTRYAAGRSVADIGGMYGIDGEHSFAAVRAGATSAVCVDLYETPAFKEKAAETQDAVRFVYGDACSMETAQEVGEVDVVWCFGLLYHVPSPLDALCVLRRMCRERLILETLGVPEVPGVRNMALWVPMLDDKNRRLWDDRRSPAGRLGITTEFDRSQGYANNFWAPSPSALRAMLETAGFVVEDISRWKAPFRYVVVATPSTDAEFQPG